jgi:hypothetical protein
MIAYVSALREPWSRAESLATVATIPWHLVTDCFKDTFITFAAIRSVLESRGHNVGKAELSTASMEAFPRGRTCRGAVAYAYQALTRDFSHPKRPHMANHIPYTAKGPQ